MGFKVVTKNMVTKEQQIQHFLSYEEAEIFFYDQLNKKDRRNYIKIINNQFKLLNHEIGRKYHPLNKKDKFSL